MSWFIIALFKMFLHRFKELQVLFLMLVRQTLPLKALYLRFLLNKIKEWVETLTFNCVQTH